MASQHAVVHRKSLAYRMFVKAAEARDAFLGNENVGDFSATLQQYYTGISLPRYLALVCIEYPIILAISCLSWLAIPGTFFYVLFRIIANSNEIGFGSSLQIIVVVVFVTFMGFILPFGAWLGVLQWAGREPNFIAKFLRKKYAGNDGDFREAPEKFPGPISLLKKWLLSTAHDGTSQITWDSGRERRSDW